MKKINTLVLLFVSFACSILLMSATPVDAARTKAPSPVERTAAAIDKARADGKVTHKELKTIVATAKGQKLTLKEKIALKIFGKKISGKVAAPPADGKSQITALVLCGLVGGLGIHRFYLGYTWQGIVQLLTLGGCGIWALIDFIRIATGDLQPKDSTYSQTL